MGHGHRAVSGGQSPFPAIGSTTRTTLPGTVGEAGKLQLEAQQQLLNEDPLGAWMGYDPPPNPLNTPPPCRCNGNDGRR
jgi:hypothetical protein